MKQEKTKSKVRLMIDTSLEIHHFALWNEGILWQLDLPMQVSIEKASAQIAGLLKESPKPSVIMFAKGPGSYTGLRFGHSFAGALASSFNVGLVAFSSFIAYSIPQKRSLVLFDARAGGLYAGLVNEKGVLEDKPFRCSKVFDPSYNQLLSSSCTLVSPEVETLKGQLEGWPMLEASKWNPSRWLSSDVSEQEVAFPFHEVQLEYLKPDHEVPSFKIKA